MPARCRIDLTAREVAAMRAALAHALDSDNSADDVALHRIDEKAARAAEKFQTKEDTSERA